MKAAAAGWPRPGQRGAAVVVHHELVHPAVREDLADVGDRLFLRAVGRIAEVDGHDAFVGDDVARHATRDAHRVQALPVLQAVDHGVTGLVRGQAGQDRRGRVDRVGAHPAARRVGPLALGLQQHPQGALAAALDLAVRGLQEHREVALQPVGVRLGHVLEAVEVRRDLFVVVEDEGQVAVGGRHRRRDAQLHRDTRLHVAGAAAPQDAVLVQPGGDVVRDRAPCRCGRPGSPAASGPGSSARRRCCRTGRPSGAAGRAGRSRSRPRGASRCRSRRGSRRAAR